MALYVVAVALVVGTYALLLLGGLVHGTDSGLACPDWPLCHGQLLPAMTGHVAYEHTHRIVATSVGFLTIALAVMALRTRRGDRPLRVLVLAAVGLVIVQGVLGGLTVLYRLPDAVSTSHLGVSMLFFATTIVLAFRARPGRPAQSVPVSPTARRWVRAATLHVFCQLLLGAIVRHADGAALACHLDLVLCRGTVWPNWHWTAQLHVLHRWNGVLILATTVATAIAIHRSQGGPRLVRLLGAAVPILVVIQIGLGVLSILTFLEVYTVTVHLGVASVLFGSLVCMWILTPSPSPTRMPAPPEMAREVGA